MQWFDYALIKYTPNPKRGETINVGLIIFLDQTADIRITSSYSKVRLIDGGSTSTDLNKLKDSMLSLIGISKTPDETLRILSSLGSGISFSNKGQFALVDKGQYEAKVKRLFDELVVPYATKPKPPGTQRLNTRLKRKFESLELLAKDASELSKHKVVQNYPINKKMGLTADFLLKNGEFHLSEVIDFNVNDTQSKLKETSFKMFTFMEGRKVLNNVNCYFVYSADHKKEHEVIQHINLAQGYSDKMFNIDSDNDFKQYISMISDLTHTEIPVMH